MTKENLELANNLTKSIDHLESILNDIAKVEKLYIHITDGNSNTVESLRKRIGYEYIKEDSELAVKYQGINDQYIGSLKKMYQDEIDALKKQFNEL